MANLSYTDLSGSPCCYTLAQKVAIGRHPAQDIQLLDRVVSKEHAVIEKQGDIYFVMDTGSRNGTFVNGTQLVQSHQLTDGDEITVGSTSFIYTESDPSQSVVERVTFHEELDSAIRTRFRTGKLLGGFVPESQIDDVEILRVDYEKLRIANELSYALSLEFDRDRLLHKILDRAFSIFKCDRGVILLRNEATGDYVPTAARLRENESSAENIRISETILLEVIDGRQAILSSDAMLDSRFAGSHSIIMEGIRSTMCVPLLYEDRLLGIIHLDSLIQSNAFSEKDLHLLSGFARQAAIALEHANLVNQIRHEALVREQLGRLLPPHLVEEVVEGRMDISKGGSEAKVTVLFADIRGFTSMAEQIPPQEIVTVLNEYFEIMVDIIFKFGGTLDKFVGDELMAIWGAPFEGEDDSKNAVQAAIEMQGALDEFNDTRRMEGLAPIHIGIGLNTGEAVAGYMGSTRSMSYTVVGDMVNTASRICSLAGPGQTVISGATLRDVHQPPKVKALPPTMVKGKREPIEIHLVLDGATIHPEH